MLLSLWRHCKNWIALRGSTSPSSGPPREEGAGLEQLKLLFDYTKFHIGLYTTIATIFAAAIASEKSVFKFHGGLLSLSIIFIGFAGLAGGIIASSCSQFTNRHDLWTTEIGPFRLGCLKGECWTYIEHTCFWIAIIAAVLSVFIGCKSTWVPLGFCPTSVAGCEAF
jgi:hypothetical protein